MTACHQLTLWATTGDRHGTSFRDGAGSRAPALPLLLLAFFAAADLPAAPLPAVPLEAEDCSGGCCCCCCDSAADVAECRVMGPGGMEEAEPGSSSDVSGPWLVAGEREGCKNGNEENDGDCDDNARGNVRSVRERSQSSSRASWATEPKRYTPPEPLLTPPLSYG